MSRGDDITDPVEAVGGVKKSSPVSAAEGPGKKETNSTGKSGFLYQTNYVLQVMKYTNIAMKHQSDIVAVRGEVAQLGTKIASDLATISQFISMIQSKAHSGGEQDAMFRNMNNDEVWFSSPNTHNGLSSDFYSINEAQTGSFASDSGPGAVSSTYKDMMTSFISAVKELYYCSPTGVGPTVKDLSTISNPSGGPDFDMSAYFKTIQSSYKDYSYAGLSVVSTDPKMHPSLIQQYMYAKAQLTIKTTDPETIKAAAGQISKVPGIDFMNGSDTFDSDLKPFMQVLASLNGSVSVQDTGGVIPWISGQTGSILSMMLNGQMYNTYNGQDPHGADGSWINTNEPEAGQVTPGLYCAFAYMAYNYIWTKNPNLDVDDKSASNTKWVDPSLARMQGWNYNGYKGSPQGDPLSALYANISSCQSNFSASGNATGTSFQQDVNSVQQVDGAAGKIADGYSQGQETLIRNFKS